MFSLTPIADFKRQLAELPTSTDVERDVIALFDGARKVRLLPERLAVASDDIQPRGSFDSAGNQSFKSRLFLPDRGGTYLRACVFLI